MCRWPAAPVSMFGLENSAWNDFPGWTTTGSKGWWQCRLQLTVEMAIAAAVEEVAELPVVLTRIEIENVLVLKPGIEFEIQTRLEREAAGIMVFQVHSRRKNSEGRLDPACERGTSGGWESRMPASKYDELQRDGFQKRAIRCLDGAGVLQTPEGARQPIGDPVFKVSAAFGKARAKR